MTPGRFNEAVMRGLVWAFVGLFFGALHGLFLVFAEAWGWPVDPRLAAGTVAGGVSALIYGSVRLAVVVATAVSLVCALLFIAVDAFSDGGAMPLWLLLVVVVPMGALIGGIYGATQRRSDCFGADCSRVFRADAKGVAGLAAGAIAALLFSFIELPGPGITVALLCAATGYLYMSLLPFCLRHFTELLPPTGDGVLVGAGVSLFIGLLFFVLVGDVEPAVVGPYAEAAARVHGLLAPMSLGGALGAGVGGFLLGLRRGPWRDD